MGDSLGMKVLHSLEDAIDCDLGMLLRVARHLHQLFKQVSSFDPEKKDEKKEEKEKEKKGQTVP